MFPGLREQLSSFGLTPFDVQLAGEPDDVAPLEGALRLRPDASGFVLETVDYGTGFRLGTSNSEEGAAELILGYIARQMPPERRMSRDEVDALVAPIAHHYFDLRDRATAAGDAGIVIDLPRGIPVDRLGALDGVHLYPIDTPFELRSLPPHVIRPENDLRQFVTATTVRVAAVITPPWFGRPGGGLRFTLQEPLTGIRDLVVRGSLERVRVSA